MNKKQIIILGAGYTGVMCALRLHGKLRGHGCHVVLIDSIARRQKKLPAALTDDIVRLPSLRRLVDDSGVEYVDVPVAVIKANDNKVVLKSGISLDYDYLLDAISATDAMQINGKAGVFATFLVAAVTGATIADSICHRLAHNKVHKVYEQSPSKASRDPIPQQFPARNPSIAWTAATKYKAEVVAPKTSLPTKLVTAIFIGLLYIEASCPGLFFWPGVRQGQKYAGQKQCIMHSSLNKTA